MYNVTHIVSAYILFNSAHSGVSCPTAHHERVSAKGGTFPFILKLCIIQGEFKLHATTNLPQRKIPLCPSNRIFCGLHGRSGLFGKEKKGLLP